MGLKSNPEGHLLRQASIQKHDKKGQHAVFVWTSIRKPASYFIWTSYAW